MNIAQLRSDFLIRQSETGMSQYQISARYGVQQAAISRFSAGKSGLSFESAAKLWPFIYGCHLAPIATPTTPPGTEPGGGDGDAA